MIPPRCISWACVWIWKATCWREQRRMDTCLNWCRTARWSPSSILPIRRSIRSLWIDTIGSIFWGSARKKNPTMCPPPPQALTPRCRQCLFKKTPAGKRRPGKTAEVLMSWMSARKTERLSARCTESCVILPSRRSGIQLIRLPLLFLSKRMKRYCSAQMIMDGFCPCGRTDL